MFLRVCFQIQIFKPYFTIFIRMTQAIIQPLKIYLVKRLQMTAFFRRSYEKYVNLGECRVKNKATKILVYEKAHKFWLPEVLSSE